MIPDDIARRLRALRRVGPEYPNEGEAPFCYGNGTWLDDHAIVIVEEDDAADFVAEAAYDDVVLYRVGDAEVRP